METLIVTTDFSESSARAAQYAAAITGPLAVHTLVLYHSYATPPAITEVPPPDPKDAALAYENSMQALAALESRIEPFNARDVTVECIANDLPLLPGVTQLWAQYEGGGLVVAGMTGSSYTAPMVDNCPAPILIVPEEAEFKPIRKAVFACDLKNIDEAFPTHMIEEIITKFDCSLLVLNVETRDPRMAGDVIPEQYKLHDKLDHLNPEYHYIEHKPISEGIMAFAEAQQAGLVLVMPRTRNFFAGLFHSSVTKKLAHHTRLPLLLLRPE